MTRARSCLTSRRTGVGDCGTEFTVGKIVHSCKYFGEHEGSHWCDCEDVLAARCAQVEASNVKLREALRLAAERFKLAFEADNVIACDVWAKEAEAALAPSMEGD